VVPKTQSQQQQQNTQAVTILQNVAAKHTTVANCTIKRYHFFKHSSLILIPDHGYLQSWECGDVVHVGRDSKLQSWECGAAVPVGCDSELLACSALKDNKL
jgi:hypothetical protein